MKRNIQQIHEGQGQKQRERHDHPDHDSRSPTQKEDNYDGNNCDGLIEISHEIRDADLNDFGLERRKVELIANREIGLEAAHFFF